MIIYFVERNNCMVLIKLVESIIIHSNEFGSRSEFEPAETTSLIKSETSGLTTELIWDELANFGFFKDATESQVQQARSILMQAR